MKDNIRINEVEYVVFDEGHSYFLIEYEPGIRAYGPFHGQSKLKLVKRLNEK